MDNYDKPKHDNYDNQSQKVFYQKDAPAHKPCQNVTEDTKHIINILKFICI